jgi:HEAT repeat protein
MADARDAAWIAPLLEHPAAAVRESAAVALGRMGEGGVAALKSALASPDARTRANAVVGAALGTSPADVPLLFQALDDPDPTVAGLSMAAMRYLPSDTLKPAVPDFKKKAARRLNSATDRDLDLNLRALLAP